MEPYVFGQFCYWRWNDLNADESEYRDGILADERADQFWAGFQLAALSVPEVYA